MTRSDSGEVRPALEKLVRPGEWHYLCWDRPHGKRERFAIKEDKRGPDGEGPYWMTWEPGTAFDDKLGMWVRPPGKHYEGLARGRDVRKALDVPPDNPAYKYAQQAIDSYTMHRKPARVPVPPGEQVILCRKCGARNLITNERA